MKQKSGLNRLIFITGLLLLVLTMPVYAQTGAPQLKLFPRDVTDMLKETGATARAMENSLRGVIGRFDKQTKLFEESSCAPDSSDQACKDIAEQISQTYQEMLDVMQESLPKMKQNIEATSKELGIRMRRQLGQKVSPAEIQNTLGKESKPEVTSGRFSLSKRFSQYHSLISSNQQSLTVLAAEIYLDTSSVAEWIDLMEAEIGRQQTIIELGRMYGSLTSEMVGTVDNVKNIVFGEEEIREGALSPPPLPEEAAEFISPLEY